LCLISKIEVASIFRFGVIFSFYFFNGEQDMSTVFKVILLSSLLVTVSAGPTYAKDFYFFQKLDRILYKQLSFHNIKPVVPPQQQDPNLVELGRNLFFEKEISGRRNISCGTCHSPLLGSADGQSQSRAQGAVGLGPFRRGIRTNNTVGSPLNAPRNGEETEFQFLPRNALSLWNRGVPEWTVMFWDGRLSGTSEEGFQSPAGPFPPESFTSALAAFSIFPVTPDEEMRGFPEQPDVFGEFNELAALTNSDFNEIWPLVTARIVDNPAYDELLDNAFDKPQAELTINDLAEALGAFMTEAFTVLNSPFDQYLAGNQRALSDDAKRGAIIFYGQRGNCVACHSGGLQTDLDFHNIAAPQVGTGRAESAAELLDMGRGAITGEPTENFKFRTPSLRNVELEAPYFHNGAYADLGDAIRHHLNPAEALADYDDSQIDFEHEGTYQEGINEELLSTLSPLLNVRTGRQRLRDREIEYLLAFLSSLTDRSSLNKLQDVPDTLPSGLPLAD